MSLKTRRLEGELMDDPALDPLAHQQALRGLKRINQVTNSYAPLWRAIRAQASIAGSPLRILDIACGSGDSLKSVGQLAARHNLAVELTGVDISPTTVGIAQRNCAALSCPVEIVQADALGDNLPGPQDVVFCSLFLHHLTDQQAARLLHNMRRLARRLVLISDLIRSPTGYAIAWVGTRLLSRSRIVHIDGPRSVAAAYTPAEMQHLAEGCGLQGYTIDRFWPERFLFQWQPHQEQQPQETPRQAAGVAHE